LPNSHDHARLCATESRKNHARRASHVDASATICQPLTRRAGGRANVSAAHR
jgi:hypothetical protein